jgi:hypothetical protein
MWANVFAHLETVIKMTWWPPTNLILILGVSAHIE